MYARNHPFLVVYFVQCYPNVKFVYGGNEHFFCVFFQKMAFFSVATFPKKPYFIWIPPSFLATPIVSYPKKS